MRISYTTSLILAPALVAVVQAASVSDLEQAVRRGDSLIRIEKMIRGGISPDSEVTLVPGRRAPLLCALVDDELHGYGEREAVDLPYGPAEAVQMLLKMGATPNVRDAQGRTALHYTSHALAQHYLLEAGADPSLADNNGQLPEVPEAEGIATEGAPTGDDETDGMTPEQIRELGVDYAEGRNGCAVDTARAIELYEQAAAAGDSKAARWMGWRYRQGRGVSRDRARSNYYFSLAAAAGDRAAYDAMDNLAPESVAGMSLSFRCSSEQVVQAVGTREEEMYQFLTPGSEEAYTVAWQGGNQGEKTENEDGCCTEISWSYTRTSKNTARVTYSFSFSHGSYPDMWYERSFDLTFSSPTGGTATCTVTGKPTTIWAEKIIYTGSFSLN